MVGVWTVAEDAVDDVQAGRTRAGGRQHDMEELRILVDERWVGLAGRVAFGGAAAIEMRIALAGRDVVAADRRRTRARGRVDGERLPGPGPALDRDAGVEDRDFTGDMGEEVVIERRVVELDGGRSGGPGWGGTPAPPMLLMVMVYVVSAAGCAYEIPVGRNTIVLSPKPFARGSLVTGIAPPGPLIATEALEKSAEGNDSDQRLDLLGRF